VIVAHGIAVGSLVIAFRFDPVDHFFLAVWGLTMQLVTRVGLLQ
jgi:hypothetical protein